MINASRALTTKQQAFCREYIIDLNASAAARRAGYSAHTSEQQGSRLLTNVEVQAEIEQAMDERAERAEVDAAYVVERLQDEAENAKSDSARVAALGLLARHLGMLTDKVEVSETTHVTRVRLVLDEELDAPSLEGIPNLALDGGVEG
jgi:phage terminase small subunit